MRALRPRTLRRQVIAVCVVIAGVLVLLAAGAAVLAGRSQADVNTLANTAGPLRTDAEALLSALVDQEAGIRGYATTRKREDLAAYDEGARREAELVAAINSRLDGRPGIRQQLRVVQEQTAQWRETVAVPVINAKAGDTAAVRSVSGPAARQRFQDLRAAVAKLRALTLDFRDEVAEDARGTGRTLVLLLVVAAAVVLLAGTALLMSLTRLVIDPVTALARQVREVASGNYERRIDATGPLELIRLGGDVDGMRRRIASDLTEVRQSRERVEWINSQLQEQADELVRSNRDLEQFAYVASHDLQEPLRKVASFCQLLQRRYASQLDERANQYIAFAVDGAQRMQRLINDLLAFSRIGRVISGFAEVDLNAAMAEIAGRTPMVGDGQAPAVTWSPLPVVHGEETLLVNLLANLVGNSLKFHRPDVPPRVHVSASRDGNDWEITCQDNGIGIEPQFADKIFVIFQRLHSKEAYAGTGIGLSIAKKIVEYHGGRIWVDPATEQGTTIRFTLPAADDDVGTHSLTVSRPASGPQTVGLTDVSTIAGSTGMSTTAGSTGTLTTAGTDERTHQSDSAIV